MEIWIKNEKKNQKNENLPNPNKVKSHQSQRYFKLEMNGLDSEYTSIEVNSKGGSDGVNDGMLSWDYGRF